MKKILALSCIVFSAIFTNPASAQTLYVGAIGGTTVPTIYVTELALSMTSSQKVGTSTVSTTNDLTAFTDNNIEPIGNVYYWNAPSITSLLSFSIGAGNYITVNNTGTTSQNVRVSVQYSPFQTPQLGTYVTVVAGGSGTLQIPLGGFTYSTSGEFGNNDPTYGYPFPIQILVTN